jgi:pentatricopeptide repeat protein
MKDRGYTTVDSRKMTKIFTLLANACYRASDSTMAIDRAIQFVDELKTKGMYVFIMINHHKLLLSDIIGFRIEYRTFNALIAAFGKHGQLKMAFQLADEMVEVGFIPNEDTYASLLIACNSEKNTGFKYAIEVKKTKSYFEKIVL